MSAHPASQPPALPWLAPGEAFPCVRTAWGPQTPAPGLLAAGGALDVPTLMTAYAKGIFPWYSAGQPVLWWSTDPRMVLRTSAFKLHRSLRKTIAQLLLTERLQVHFDRQFERVIEHCAQTPRAGQDGTWILPAMVNAYTALHHAGHAHSAETWLDGQLVGGLYFVNIGGMVFGESMFSHRSNASKIALAALVAFCRASGIELIDCQQNTSHLALLGAQLMCGPDFSAHLEQTTAKPAPHWAFAPDHWQHVLGGGARWARGGSKHIASANLCD